MNNKKDLNFIKAKELLAEKKSTNTIQIVVVGGVVLLIFLVIVMYLMNLMAFKSNETDINALNSQINALQNNGLALRNNATTRKNKEKINEIIEPITVNTLLDEKTLFDKEAMDIILNEAKKAGFNVENISVAINTPIEAKAQTMIFNFTKDKYDQESQEIEVFIQTLRGYSDKFKIPDDYGGWTKIEDKVSFNLTISLA